MNKIGIYYAYWTSNWNVDFHPYIDKASDAGFDVLEVNAGTVADMNSSERKALLSHASDRGLRLSFVIGLPKPYDIASEDVETRRNGIAYLQKIARAVGEMGGGPVGGIIYGCWPAAMPEGQIDKRPYLEHSVNSMREAIKAAEDNQALFCMEVVNRFEQFLLNTCAEGVAYIKAVGSPAARVMLDTFHMNIEEDFLGKAILEAGDTLGHFHIGENNRMPPGYGHIPWTEVGAALRQISYSGYVVMEPFLKPGGEVGRDIKVFRDLSKNLDLDDEAHKALLFMRGVLK